jgi:hypothetical protein
MSLADDVALLVDWLRHDIFTVAGPCYADRRELYNFVVAELRARTSRCPHRLEPICRALEKQRDDLLAFARQLDEDLEQLGQNTCQNRCQVPLFGFLLGRPRGRDVDSSHSREAVRFCQRSVPYG